MTVIKKARPSPSCKKGKIASTLNGASGRVKRKYTTIAIALMSLNVAEILLFSIMYRCITIYSFRVLKTGKFFTRIEFRIERKLGGSQYQSSLEKQLSDAVLISGK